MTGLVIWAQSNCRSTMALYREMLQLLKCPALITLWHYNKSACEKDIREKIGFSHDEFAGLPIEPVGEDLGKGLAVLDAHPGWSHLFCVWQPSPVYRQLIVEAKRRGSRVGVMCESPCNMGSGLGWMLKQLYMIFVLPYLARRIAHTSDFFVNFSGDNRERAKGLGWEENKIIPFGYYPPPIPGAKCVKRSSDGWFHILATGVLSRYRGADVLVEALRILSSRGINYTATITQTGELLPSLKKKALVLGLPVKFAGFVEMSELIDLYQSCSVYVGAGRQEPWGMRLNDALNCGAPLVVSSGMGGRKIVDDYACGLVFESGNAMALADALQKMARDKDFYANCANNVIIAAEACSPRNKAAELLGMVGGKLK